MTRKLSNRYVLGDVIGVGGSAEVFAAHDVLLDRQVAVKVLDERAAKSNDPTGRKRFLAEAQSSARFDHPHAVAVYDAGDSDGELFIVMELVDGVSLAHVLADEGSLAEKTVVRFMTQLLGALQAAHEAGLVHRDIKPANILITRGGDVKLADFGIAKRFDDLADGVTSAGMVIGTERYLAPEQAAGEPVTPQSDLYAVALVAYEMLTGERPGRAASPSVRAHRPGVSPSIDAIIGQALATDPADRPVSAAVFAASLHSGLGSTTTVPAVPTHADVGPTSAMEVAPGATAVMGVSLPPKGSNGGRWLLVVVVALVLAFSGVALAQRGPSDSDQVLADTTPGDAAVEAEPTATPTSPGAPDATSDSEAAPTVVEPEPLATSAPPTISPTAPVPAEIMPGFPATTDVFQFIEQLRDGEDLAGKQSKKLGDELSKVVDSDPEDAPKKADKLEEKLLEWVEKGEIDPRVAEATFDFLRMFG